MIRVMDQREFNAFQGAEKDSHSIWVIPDR